ncbi:MAG: 4Fe-4S dicluster domain-containing protein [Candidatus Hodarchaeota archaeon]
MTFIPILYQDKEKNKILMLQFDRCKGCNLCIEVCPRKILKMGDQLNKRTQYPPVLINDDAKCTFCQECEINCPDYSIYVVEDYKE